MALTIIEINDYQLTLTRQDKCHHQLGYALVTKDRVIFGDDAYRQAKTSPANVYCHYWQRLGYEKITSANSQIRHFADLAYLQLQHLIAQVTACSEVVFIVPSSYNQQQLSLLLGIAQSCQLQVVGLVNGALLRLADCHQRGKYALLDIGLHHCDYNQLVAAKDIYLEQSQSFADKGIYNLYNHLAYWLNQRFIAECRFDAFHRADTEQSLYDQLPNLLLKSADCYNISVSDKTVKIRTEQLNQQIGYFFQDIINAVADVGKGYLTRRFAAILSGLPINDSLPQLDPALIYALVIKHIESIAAASSTGSQGINLITRLPADLPLSNHSSPPSDDISHIVCKDRAYPLNNRALSLSEGNEQQITLNPDSSTSAVLKPVNGQWQLNLTNNKPVFVNEHPAISGQFLARGDRVRLGRHTTVFTLIKVEKEL